MARIKGKAVIEKKANALRELKITYVKPESIKPNEYNPNRQDPHDYELLLKSMTEDGFTQPIIVQKKTNTIVDGEHRWKAAQELGYKEIPVVFVDMTPEQMKIATLRHNRARGEEDIELTANVLRDLQDLGAIEWAQDSLMLDDEEINRLIEDIPAPEALMGEEFNEAWEPDKIIGEVEINRLEKNEPLNHVHDTDDTYKSHTQKAQESLKEREHKIQQAKNREDREQAKKEMKSVYRITLVFHAEEADIVKAVLKDNPADKILELCTEKLNQES